MYFEYGVSLFHFIGDYVEALKKFNKVIELDPDYKIKRIHPLDESLPFDYVLSMESRYGHRYNYVFGEIVSK